MASFLLLIACLVLGVLVGNLARPPEGFARSLNWYVLRIALPAVVLAIIPHLQFDASLWYLVIALWSMFGLAWLLFHALGTRLHWSRGTIGAVVMMAGFSNSAFVGLPLIETLRGAHALSYAAIADQMGSFISVTIGGTVVVAMYSGSAVDGRTIFRNIITWPPFIALIVAGCVALTPGWPPMVEAVLTRIGAAMTPIALFSIGLQLSLRLSAHRMLPFLMGLGWKLCIAPALVLGCGLLMHIDEPILTVAVLQAAMAPMTTAAIMAEQGDLDPPLTNMMAGLGILISFVTVPLWNLLL